MNMMTKEQRKLSEEEENEIVRTGEAYEALLKQPGWTLLSAIAAKQRETQLAHIVQPASPRDEDQYRKGLIAGLGLLLMTPALTIEHRKEILLQRQELGMDREGGTQ